MTLKISSSPFQYQVSGLRSEVDDIFIVVEQAQ